MSSLPVEDFWAELLSCEQKRIVDAWGTLTRDEAAAVHRHLKKMAAESGWTETQRTNARAALDVLSDRGLAK